MRALLGALLRALGLDYHGAEPCEAPRCPVCDA